MKIHSIDNLFDFKNKVILISGTSGLLGASLAKLFLDIGSIVIGFDLKKQKIFHKNFYHATIDITDEKKIKKNFDKIYKKFKQIDVIINNAGVSIFTKFEKRKKKELIKTFQVNIVGTINICKNYFLLHKKMKLKKCKIINIGSIYGNISPDFRIYGKNDNFNSEIYGATKAGVIQLTKYLSVLMSKYNINVNSMSPGGIYNEIKKQNPNFVKKYKSRVPLNRMAKSSDFFTCVLFLASDNSSYVTGQNIMVDGGLSAW